MHICFRVFRTWPPGPTLAKTLLSPFSHGAGMYKLGFKAWLEQDGRFVLSQGKAELLYAIKKEGSLRAAAAGLGISYRHAWDMLRKMRAAVGRPMVSSVRGGLDRGRTALTPEGEEVLLAYEMETRKLRRSMGPWLTVDAVIEKNGKLLLVKRGNPPFEAAHALPGGFVETGETVEEAVVREVEEETGLRTAVTGLLGVYSDPERDPRGHTVSVVFKLAVRGGTLMGGDDAAYAAFFPLEELPQLAFDHGQVVRDYLRARK